MSNITAFRNTKLKCLDILLRYCCKTSLTMHRKVKNHYLCDRSSVFSSSVISDSLFTGVQSWSRSSIFSRFVGVDDSFLTAPSLSFRNECLAQYACRVTYDTQI